MNNITYTNLLNLYLFCLSSRQWYLLDIVSIDNIYFSYFKKSPNIKININGNDIEVIDINGNTLNDDGSFTKYFKKNYFNLKKHNKYELKILFTLHYLNGFDRPKKILYLYNILFNDNVIIDKVPKEDMVFDVYKKIYNKELLLYKRIEKIEEIKNKINNGNISRVINYTR